MGCEQAPLASNWAWPALCRAAKRPAGGSAAGPGGPALQGRNRGGATGKFYTQHTISADGSRIFFTDISTGQIYMREPQAARTVAVSAGSKPAYWAPRPPTVRSSSIPKAKTSIGSTSKVIPVKRSRAAPRECSGCWESRRNGLLCLLRRHVGACGERKCQRGSGGRRSGQPLRVARRRNHVHRQAESEGFDPYAWQGFSSRKPQLSRYGGKSSHIRPMGRLCCSPRRRN